MFNLPDIHGQPVPRKAEDVIFFSCDYDYFDRHGYALAQSIVRTVGWIHVHCHIINEGNMKKPLLDDLSKYPFTYTYENIGSTFYKDLENNKRMKEGRPHSKQMIQISLLEEHTLLVVDLCV